MYNPLFGNEIIFGNKCIEIGGDERVTLIPVLCKDGLWRWSVASFENVQAHTPYYISNINLNRLENWTDKDENPDYYQEEK